jgi:hypothetical protein
MPATGNATVVVVVTPKKPKSPAAGAVASATTIKVPHVYIFDRKNVCHFGGYVGWFHLEALKEVISGIKEEFDEDSAK